MKNEEDNIIDTILDALESSGYIATVEREPERKMFETYARDNDLWGFWNNEGYEEKYDCCFRNILQLFGVIMTYQERNQ